MRGLWNDMASPAEIIIYLIQSRQQLDTAALIFGQDSGVRPKDHIELRIWSNPLILSNICFLETLNVQHPHKIYLLASLVYVVHETVKY